MEARSAIQRIVLEHRRRYGYRRVAAELRRQGMAVNRKRAARLMREDNLLAVEPRAFVATTDSNHQCTAYLNLARQLEPTGIDQLRVADITYIRLHSALGYRTPEEHERELGHSSPDAPKMSFLRHEEGFRSDGDENKTGAKAENNTPSIVSTILQLAIPRQVGLNLNPPPLRQQTTACNRIG